MSKNETRLRIVIRRGREIEKEKICVKCKCVI